MRCLRAGAGAAIAALALAFGPVAARPLTIDDVLRVEGLGQVSVSGDGRWLALERRRAYETGARFDYGQYTDLFRTELQGTDLSAPTALRPLFPHEPGAGYALGPFSPDGRRLVVFRIKAGRWELGVAEPARRAVAWTGLTPELLEQGRSVAWVSPSRLAALVLPEGLAPMTLRLHAPTQALPSRWATTARGGTSVTAVGSGRLRNVRPQDPASRLLLLDADSGVARTVASGRFVDLEISASGRWAALLEAGEDVVLQPGRQIQGDYGLARRRMRLRLVELDSGRVSTPCRACDLIGSLLAWSPYGEELLVFARQDGQPWTEGRLLRIDVGGRTRAVADDRLKPIVSGRPETVRAGWMGGDPLVYARPRGGATARADWWRIGSRDAHRLTGGLTHVPVEGLAATQDRLLLTEGGRARLLDKDGRILDSSPKPLSAPAPAFGPPFPRFGRLILQQGAIGGLVESEGGAWLAELGADGSLRRWRAPPGAELLLHAPGRGALTRVPEGGADGLVWIDGRGAFRLDMFNAHLADVDLPSARPVRHLGRDGRPAVSWLVLPAGPAPAQPPPLVIWPYAGRAYPAPPLTLHPRFGLMEDPPRLLAAHGYAVLLPSLPPPGDERVPSDGLADALLEIVDAAAAQPELAGAFDPKRVGLWGHSFGGYSVIAAITQTHRFRAAVAAAAMPNLFAKWGDLAPRRYWPEQGLSDPGWTEDLQGDTRGPPWSETDRFVRGSPLLQMDRARTPLLLVHGEFDNFSLLGAEQAFSAYLRQDRDAVLATYWGEAHVLRSPGNLRDYYGRALTFLNEHLDFTPPGPARPRAKLSSAAPRPLPPPHGGDAGRPRAR